MKIAKNTNDPFFSLNIHHYLHFLQQAFGVLSFFAGIQVAFSVYLTTIAGDNNGLNPHCL